VNEDFRDLLAALLATEARFLVVGAHAMAVHGVPRATGDLDVWIAPDPANADRVWSALLRFGAPVAAMGGGPDDLTRPDRVELRVHLFGFQAADERDHVVAAGHRLRAAPVQERSMVASSSKATLYPGLGPADVLEGHRAPDQHGVPPLARTQALAQEDEGQASRRPGDSWDIGAA
jgi:hypothetical protein